MHLYVTLNKPCHPCHNVFVQRNVQLPQATNPMLYQLQQAAQQQMQAAVTAMQQAARTTTPSTNNTRNMWLQAAPVQTAPFVVYALHMNNKMYIGQTDNLIRRLKQHNRNPPKRMQQEIQQGQKLYNCCSVQILHQVQDQQQANRLETTEILCRRTRHPDFGYNNLKGTPVSDPRYYHIVSKSKQRTSE